MIKRIKCNNRIANADLEPHKQLCTWLTANGIDHMSMPMDQTLTIAPGLIHFTHYVRNANGNLQLRKPGQVRTRHAIGIITKPMPAHLANALTKIEADATRRG